LSGYLTSASAASTYATLTGTGASGPWGISITGSAAQLGGAGRDAYVYGDGNNLGSFNTFLGDGGVGANNISRSGFYRDNNSHFGALGIHVQHASNSGYAIQLSWAGYDAGGFAVRAKQAGTWGSSVAILTANTYSSYALPLVGGTMTGPISTAQTTAFVQAISNSEVLLADHISDSTPVPWDIRKSGNTIADSDTYGVLHLTRTNHTNTATTNNLSCPPSGVYLVTSTTL